MRTCSHRRRNIPKLFSGKTCTPCTAREKKRGQVSTFNTGKGPTGFKVFDIGVRKAWKGLALGEKAGQIHGGEGIGGLRDKGMK
jgi:hypothetical protein